MAHKVICPYCKITFDRDKEPFIKVNAKRYAHVYCAEHIEEVMPTEDYELKQLSDYIKDKYGNKAKWPLIKQQIENFKTNLNFTYSGMLGSLIYFYDIKKGSIKESNGGIGIIEYVYEDAKNYYQDLTIKQSNIKNLKGYIPEIEEVTIDLSEFKKRKIKLFNLEEE